jgi:hypothetical protein
LYRSLLAAALLLPAAAHAQSASPPEPRPMPGYQDDEAQWRGGTEETYGTEDLHHHVDQTPPPPPVPNGYGYGGYDEPPPAPADGWRAPRPYARPDQVDQGNPNDAAHRADRARTATLNRRPWRGYNAAPSTGPGSGSYADAHAQYQAELAAHAQDMQRYRAEQAQYQQRMGNWRAQSDACQQGDDDACEGPR